MMPQDPDASTLPPMPAAPPEQATIPPDPRATPAHDPWSTQAGQAPLPDFSAALGLPAMARYEILEELGRGGMGVVYKARQAGLNRLVALKMILSGAYAGAEELKRFRLEAEAIARLQHPNIVQIYEVGEQDGRPYFSLEYVDGGSLAQHQRGQPQPPREAAALVETLARAMQAAHDRGIVHRDLKPGNILLQRLATDEHRSTRMENQSQSVLIGVRPCSSVANAVPKIADFGLAKQTDRQTGHTAEGAILGTPSYMAPEQAGQGKQVGPAADIYALGAILYELLIGRPPFQAATPLDTILQVLEQEPEPPSRLQKGVPPDLETICVKCLEKEPGKRYGSAALLAEDLALFLAGKPIAARPVGQAERLVRWCRRNPVVAGLLTLVATTLFVGAVSGSLLAAWALSEKGRADVKANDALTEKQRADASAAEAESNLYLARMNLAQTDWENGNVARILDLLEPYRKPQADKRDLRGWEWSYQDRLCHAELRSLHGHTAPVHSVAFSPDGSRLASASSDWTIAIWDTATGKGLHSLKGHTDDVLSVAFSPDGSRLASASLGGTIKIWDAATGQELRTLKRHTKVVQSVAFSPDGSRLASASGDQTISLWDAASGQELRTLKGHTQGVNCLAFNPDGSLLVSASWDETIKIWDAASGQELRTLKGHTNLVMSVAFSPDGSRLASAGWDLTIKVWDAATGQELRTIKGHTGVVTSVAFSPDGSQLASASEDKTIKVWDAATGQELRALKGHTHMVNSVAFSPDGSQLASASEDKTIKVWDAASGQELRALKRHTHVVNSVSFSPDGSRLASASGDETIKVWDTASGQELRTLKGHAWPVTSVAFSPDGSRLASASYDKTIRVWDAATGQELRALKGHTDSVTSVAFSPNGSRLASASYDRTIRVWDAATGQELCILMGHTGAVTSVAFSPDGSPLASASWDGTIRVWDAATGQELRTLKGHTNMVNGVAFSPDGSRLASAGWDQTIKVWDAATGQELRTLKGYTNVVTSVAFSPDGSRLASASYDKTIKVWDAAIGQELRTLKGRTGVVTSVAFSPDGSRLASGGEDGTINLWDARPLSLEVRRQREALGLVEYQCPKSSSKANLVERIGADKGITEEVRQEARSLLNDYWPRHIQVEATASVNRLFSEGLLRTEVLKRIRADRTLRDAVRQEALTLAGRQPENALALNQRSWSIVRRPDAKAEEYQAALRQAEAACRIEPRNGFYLNTLGIAQYRADKFAEAIDTLMRSSQLNAVNSAGPHPADLAFLALAHAKLGQKKEALDYRQRLRKIAGQPNWASDAETQGFLREVETQFKGEPTNEKP